MTSLLRHHRSPSSIKSLYSHLISSPSKPLPLHSVNSPLKSVPLHSVKNLTANTTSVNSSFKPLPLHSVKNLTASVKSPLKPVPLLSGDLTAEITSVNFSSSPLKSVPLHSVNLTAEITSVNFSSSPLKPVRLHSGDLTENITSVKSPLKRVTLPSKVDSGGLAAEDMVLDDDDDDEYAPVRDGVKTSTIPTLLQPRVVVYDGVCHLCHRGVKLVIKADKDRKIKFCCLQSEAAEPYMRICGVDREDVLRRFLFIEGPDAYHQGSTAALKVLSYLPLPYSALSTLMVVPTPIRDAAYDYIAKHRYDWFGKDTNCLVLKEKELLERFIDRDEMIHKKWSDD